MMMSSIGTSDDVKIENPFFLDIDRTMVDPRLSLGCLGYLAGQGYMDSKNLKEITRIYESFKSGTMAYSAAACRIIGETGAGLKGANKEDVQAAVGDYIAENSGLIYPYVGRVCGELDRRGYRGAIITGATREFAEELSKYLGLNVEIHSSELMTDSDENYAGRVLRACALNRTKKNIALGYLTDMETARRALSFGDTSHDPLDIVGYPIVVNPMGSFKEEAQKNGWYIVEDPTDAGIAEAILAHVDASPPHKQVLS
ncbi:MAG: HAD family hydrolase [Candidatus Aenigmatarchaeota archaeon]